MSTGLEEDNDDDGLQKDNLDTPLTTEYIIVLEVFLVLSLLLVCNDLQTFFLRRSVGSTGLAGIQGLLVMVNEESSEMIPLI